MAKKKKITFIIPEVKVKAVSKWYTLCPWCDHKTACSTTMSSVCPECGGNAFIIPCGIVRE